MTAEIVVMNKQAAALAADSAVTFGLGENSKHFQSANKIFTLSKYHPVGIMIYGSAQFMGVPWETVIKDYREQLETQRFEVLEDYAEDFLTHLADNRTFSPPDVQRYYYRQLLEAYFGHIRDAIEQEWKAVIEAKDSITTPEYLKIAKKEIRDHRDYWREIDFPSESIPSDFDDQLEATYKDTIVEVKEEVFENLLTSTTSRWLTEIAVDAAIKAAVANPDSGLVIVGFGSEERFPKQAAFSIGGVLADELLYERQDRQSVDYQHSGIISAYAQKEMVASFMEGIDPKYRGFVDELFSDILRNLPELIVDSIDCLEDEEIEERKEEFREVGGELLDEFRGKLNQYSHQRHINPIVSVVSVLPKEDLAEMARSLVYLTVLKRRMSLQDESVDEPIDVAVISKGDGFIWIDRKHYFEPELNHHFFENYFRHFASNKEGKETDDE